jgi:hypothetical protein
VEFRKAEIMTYRNLRIVLALFLVGLTGVPDASAATLKPETLQAWETYAQLTEKRINEELARGGPFLGLDFKKPEERDRIRKVLLKEGTPYVEKKPIRDARDKEFEVEDGMIHHWVGSIFVPRVKLETLRRWVQNYDRHADYFAEVEKSKLLSRDGENFKIYLRLVRKKVLTVRYNTEHSVVYRDHSATRVSSRSIATKIAEISGAGTAAEKEKTSANDQGFMWRLNSYWRFEETAGGVIVECESISLSRSIPFGFGWVARPFVESVPKESLHDMLAAIRDGVGGKN